MKIRTNDITSWVFCDDVNAGITQIRTEETPGWDRQRADSVISDIGEAIVILTAVLVIWTPIVVMLWP